MNHLFNNSWDNSTYTFFSEVNFNISDELLSSLWYWWSKFAYNLYKYCKYQAKKSNFNHIDLNDFILELNKIVYDCNNKINSENNLLFQILILEYLLVLNNDISYYWFTQEKKLYEKSQIKFFRAFNLIKQFCISNNIEMEIFSFFIAYDFMKEFIPFYWSKYSNKFFYPDDLCWDLFCHCNTVLIEFWIVDSKTFLLDIFSKYELNWNSHFNNWWKNEFYKYLKQL